MSKVYNKEELQLRINDILSYLRNIIEDPEGAGVYFSDKLADIFMDVLTGNGDSGINKKFGMVTLVKNTIQFFANEEEYNIYLEDPIKNRDLLLGKVTLPSNTSTTPSIPNHNIDLSNYVTLNTDQNISGIKNFLSGIKINNSPILTYDSTTKSWLLEGNLIVTGGGAFRAALGDLNVPTIMDAILVDEQTITKDFSSGQPVLKVLKAGLDREELLTILSEEEYTTQTWVNDKLTKFALKSDLPDTSTLVDLSTYQEILEVKDFKKGLKLNSSPIITYDSTTKSFLFDGNIVVTGGGVFRATLGDIDVPTIMDAINTDEVTISKEGGILKVLKAGLDSTELEKYLEPYLKEADAKNTYATKTYVNDLSTKFDNFLTGSDTDTIINKWKELETFLSGLSESDDLATLLSSKANKATTLSGYGITDAYTKTEITTLLSEYVRLEGTAQDIKVRHNFTEGLKIGGLPIYKSQDGVIYIDSNVVISRGLTVRGTDGTTAPSIWESIPFDNTMKWDGSQWSVVGGGVSVTKDSVINALGYTPLSTGGGTITGEMTISCAANTPLKINSNATDSGVYFNHNGISKTWVGFEASRGSVLYHSVGSHRLGINNDGVAFYDSNTLLHSGNYAEYAVKKNVFINTAIADNEYGYGYVDGGWPEAGSAMVFGAGNYKAGIQVGALGSAIRYGYTAGTTSFTWRTILDDNNYSNYALPLTGGTVNGAITINDYAKITNALYIGGVLRNANGEWLLGESSANGGVFVGTSSYAQERAFVNYHGKLSLTAEGGVEAQLPFLYSNPSIGSLDNNGVFRLVTSYGWGIYAWVRNTGNSYVQVGTDSRYSNPNVHNIILQGLGGNVAVGGETASEKLHVHGNVKATSFIGSLSGNAATSNKLIEEVVTDLNNATAGRIFTMTSGYGSTAGNKPTTGWVTGITLQYAQNGVYRRQLAYSDDFFVRDENNGSWGDWRKILTSTNFYDYALSKDGTASAAWKLANARYLWGQLFNGTSNIGGQMSFNAGDFILAHNATDAWADTNGLTHPWYGIDFRAGGSYKGYISHWSGISLVSGNDITLSSDKNVVVSNGKFRINQSAFNNGLTLNRTSANAGAGIVFQSNGNLLGQIGINSTKTFEVSDGTTIKASIEIPTGNLLVTGGITARYTSDERLKTNLRPINAGQMILSLGRVREFEYIPSEIKRNNLYKGRHIGLIYQDVKGSALSKMCFEREDGYGSLNYLDTSLKALLVGVAQEHEIRFTKVEQDNQALKEENKALRKEIEYLKQRVV